MDGGAQYPFFSPDGRSIGFFAAGQLKRLSLDGGALVLDLRRADCHGCVRTPTWRNVVARWDDRVRSGPLGLMRVAADGGTPIPVKSNDPAMDARDLSWPSFLPGGKALLVSVSDGASDSATSVAVLSLETGEWQVVTQGSQATYLPSGHLVFHASHVREGDLQVLPFDAEQPASTGPPTSVLSGLFRSADAGGLYYAVSRSGRSHSLAVVSRIRSCASTGTAGASRCSRKDAASGFHASHRMGNESR